MNVNKCNLLILLSLLVLLSSCSNVDDRISEESIWIDDNGSFIVERDSLFEIYFIGAWNSIPFRKSSQKEGMAYLEKEVFDAHIFYDIPFESHLPKAKQLIYNYSISFNKPTSDSMITTSLSKEVKYEYAKLAKFTSWDSLLVININGDKIKRKKIYLPNEHRSIDVFCEFLYSGMGENYRANKTILEHFKLVLYMSSGQKIEEDIGMQPQFVTKIFYEK